MLRLFSLFLSAVIFFSLPCYAEDNKVTATVDKQSVRTGEVFTYRVEVTGLFKSPKITLPEFKNFRVVSQSQSKSYSFHEGKTKLLIKLIVNLLAINPGVFAIGAVTVKDNGDVIESAPINVEVTGNALPPKRKTPKVIDRGFEI